MKMMSSCANFPDSVSAFLSAPSSTTNNSGSVTFPHDDIWKKFDDFLLTPPQSPPVKLDLQTDDDLLEIPDLLDDVDLTAALDGLLEEATSFSDAGLAEVLQSFAMDSPDTGVVNNDCMWSTGTCLDVNCTHRDTLKCGRYSVGIPSIITTPIPIVSKNLSNIDPTNPVHLLGSSPFGLSSFCPDMLVCEEQLTSGDSGNSSMDDDEEVPTFEDSEEDEDQSPFISGSESLIDHSYGSSCPGTPNFMAKSKFNSQPSVRKDKRTTSSTCTSLLFGGMTKKLSSSSSSSSCSSSSFTSSSPATSPRKSKKKSLAQQKKEELLAPVPVKFVKRSKTLSTSSKSGTAVGVSRSKSAGRKVSLPKIVVASGLKRKNQNSENQQSTPAKQCKSAQAKTSKSTSSSLTPSTSSLKCLVTASPTMSPPAQSPSSTNTLPTTSTVNTSPALSTSILKVNVISSSSRKSKSGHFPEKRREHNDSEKKRRDHLRNAFHTLRDQVPKLRENGRKPARIIILYEAVAFVNLLVEKSQYLERIKKQETDKREKLLKKLSQLEALP